MTEHQHTTPTPEHAPERITAERLMETKYGQGAIAVLGDIPNFNEKQNVHHVKEHFVDAILADADRGEILSTSFNPETGEKLMLPVSSDELLHSMEVGLRMIDADGVQSIEWRKRIPRYGGLRDAFVALMETNNDRTKADDVLRYAVTLASIQREKAREEAAAAAEAAKVDENPGLIIDVPEHIKNSIPVVEQEAAPVPITVHEEAPIEVAEQEVSVDPMVEMTKDLSVEDRLALRGFAEAMMLKKQLQRDGNGQEAQIQQQYAGQEFRKMSPAAKDISRSYADRYARIYG